LHNLSLFFETQLERIIMEKETATIPVVTGVVPVTGVAASIGMNGEPTTGMVQVVAPMDLEAGYQLEVDVNGQKQSVTVPAGGVKQGQSFHAQPRGSAIVGGAVAVPDGIPIGKWRDELCNCCTFGPCHAMCCLGYWCTPGESTMT
jgi:hypothetical protein